MDLIDLYHAHEYGLAIDEGLYKKEIDVIEEENEQTRLKPKKPKFVPWEPYKAAPAPDRKGEAPLDLPTLIPYRSSNAEEKTEPEDEKQCLLVDQRKLRENRPKLELPTDEQVLSLEKDLEEMKRQLDLERKLNAEMKNMFLSSLGDDLQTQVEALAGDKIHLGRRLEEYCEKVAVGNEEVEGLKIERDVWKCKFQAQSIRADELTSRVEYLLNLLRRAQDYIETWGQQTSTASAIVRSPPPQVLEFAKFDLQKLYLRSPCDPRLIRSGPNFSNLTISCCRGCTGREIKLL